MYIYMAKIKPPKLNCSGTYYDKGPENMGNCFGRG